jgi:hypothetical protein
MDDAELKRISQTARSLRVTSKQSNELTGWTIHLEPERAIDQPENEEHSTNLETIPSAPVFPVNSNELTGWKLTVLIASLCSAIFCVALDNTSS